MTNSTRAYRTQYMAQLRQRRSRWLALLACTSSAVAMLTGCGSPRSQDQGGDWNVPATEEAVLYNSLAECKAEQADDRICDEARADAAAMQEQRPSYSQKEQCEAQYGVGNCESRGSQGWFVPAMAGFMMARAMNGASLDTYRNYKRGGAASAYPVYVDRNGQVSTYSGSGVRPLGVQVDPNNRALPPRVAVQPDSSGRGYTAPGTYSRSSGPAASTRGGFGNSSAVHGGCCG